VATPQEDHLLAEEFISASMEFEVWKRYLTEISCENKGQPASAVMTRIANFSLELMRVSLPGYILRQLPPVIFF